MLNNRVLVVGIDRSYLELLSMMKSEFLFISINHPDQFDPINHAYESLVFSSEHHTKMSEILKTFEGRPIFAIGNDLTMKGVLVIPPPPNPSQLESTLLRLLGGLRSPPKDTGDLDPGTIVKNKFFASWGLGIVKKKLENDLLLVVFPDVKHAIRKGEHVCHKTALRKICTAKELA